MESEEMALMNLFSGQQRRKRHKEWTYGQGGRKLENETKQEHIITQSVKNQIGSKFIGQN